MKNCFRLKISLNDTKPVIWRELLVPVNFSFYQLHHTLQIAMGWTSSHLFEFNLEGFQIGYVFDEPFDDQSHVINCRDVFLQDLILHKKETFTYWYDFGDSWYHTIVIEDFISVPNNHPLPFCIAGELRCPPEDCGGISGFYELLSILSNKKNKEYRSTKAWVGPNYTPLLFDLPLTNKQLKRLNKYIDLMDD